MRGRWVFVLIIKRNAVIWVKEASMRLANHLLHANSAAKRLVVFSSGADVAGLSDFFFVAVEMFNSAAAWT